MGLEGGPRGPGPNAQGRPELWMEWGANWGGWEWNARLGWPFCLSVCRKQRRAGTGDSGTGGELNHETW